MIWLLLVLALVPAQEVRRPARRVIAGETTPTPTPGPCDHCPAPGSIGCVINYPACVQCWEDCGQPIATPTPTPTVTPTPTPPPVGPECVVWSRGGIATLVGIYAHEAEPKVRYVYVAGPTSVPPGVLRPLEVEGTPVGYEWYVNGTVLASCGDTNRVYPKIFTDGFESGDAGRWSHE